METTLYDFRKDLLGSKSPVQEFVSGSESEAMGDDPSSYEPLKRTREYDVPAAIVSKPHILVADDDCDVCEAVKEVLDEGGFDTACVSNGELALAHLREQPATAVVLLDLMMPLMNGWTLFDRVRSIPQFAGIPVIVITATAAYWGYPTSQVLRKPMGRNELLSAVRSALARGRVPQAAGG